MQPQLILQKPPLIKPNILSNDASHAKTAAKKNYSCRLTAIVKKKYSAYS